MCPKILTYVVLNTNIYETFEIFPILTAACSIIGAQQIYLGAYNFATS